MAAKLLTSIWSSTVTHPNNCTSSDGFDAYNSTDLVPLWKEEVSVFLSVLLSLIIITSVVGNTLELVVILKSRKMRTKTNIFIANLAFADLGVTLLCMPFSLTTLLAGKYVFSMTVCNINAFCDALFLLASIHGLLGVSIQKYFALVRPLSGAITQRRINYMIAGAWALAFFSALGPVLGWTDTEYKPGASQCGPKYPETVVELLHGYYNILVGLAIPLSVFIFVYISVYIATRRYSKRLKRNTTYGEEKIFRQQLRIVKTIFGIVVSFLLFWSPYFIYASWILMGDVTKVPIWFNTFAYMCGFANSAINPLIYGLRTKSFRRELKRMFGFKSSGSSPNQSEIRSQASVNSFKPVLDFLQTRADSVTPTQSIESFHLINSLIRPEGLSVSEERLLEVYRIPQNGVKRTNVYQEAWVDVLNDEREPYDFNSARTERVFSEGQKDKRFDEREDTGDVPEFMSFRSCPAGESREYVL